MAVVLFMSTLVSVAPAVEYEEEGRASDCASYWRTAVMDLAAANGDNPNTDMVGPNLSYLDLYMIAYTECLND